MAEQLFGYGRWDAPFWFIGPEAGMGQDGTDNLGQVTNATPFAFQRQSRSVS